MIKPGEERQMECRQCGGVYTAWNANAKFCPKCRESRKRAANTRKVERQRLDRERKRAEEKREQKKVLTVAEVAVMAREAHMTYGEYVSRYEL